MKKILWGLGAAAAWAVVVACSSSSSGYKFPFSGPSCNGGPPGTTTPTACDTCEENTCGGTAGCLSSDCSAYFNCLCACQPSDATCLQGCPQPTAACTSCENSIESCIQTAATGSCSSQCGSASSSSSGGTSSGSSSGGVTATGACAQVVSCCQSFPSADQSACMAAVTETNNNQTVCQEIVAGYQDAGLCH
jgi:hypothetical protein